MVLLAPPRPSSFLQSASYRLFKEEVRHGFISASSQLNHRSKGFGKGKHLYNLTFGKYPKYRTINLKTEGNVFLT